MMALRACSIKLAGSIFASQSQQTVAKALCNRSGHELLLQSSSPCAVKLIPQILLIVKRTIAGTSNLKSADRLYTEKHEWITVDNNVGTVGITDYAQDALGDVVYAQLPDEGSEFEQGDDFGALESVKAASELYAPVSGKVVEKNAAVEDKPALINTSCYDEGWLIKVELSKKEELKELMDEAGYKEYLKSQQDE